MKVKALSDCFIEGTRRKAGVVFDLSKPMAVMPKYIQVLDNEPEPVKEAEPEIPVARRPGRPPKSE